MGFLTNCLFYPSREITCTTLLTRGDLLCHVVGDRGLSALPTEPLVGPGVSTDGESEGLRLPPVFVHSSFHTGAV